MAVVVIHLSFSKKKRTKKPAQHLCNGDALMRLHSAPESLFQKQIPDALVAFLVQHHFKCARAHAGKHRQTWTPSELRIDSP